MPQGCRRNEHVCIVHALPGGLRHGLEFTELLHGFVIRMANRDESKQRLHLFAVFIAALGLLDTIKQFPFHHRGHPQIIVLVRIEQSPGDGFISTEEAHTDIRVKKRHNSTFLPLVLWRSMSLTISSAERLSIHEPASA